MLLSAENTAKNWINGYNFLAFTGEPIYNIKSEIILEGLSMKLKKLIVCVLILCVAMLAFSACAGTTASADGTTSSTSSLTMLLPMLLIFVIFYFLMIRPENKRKKKAQEMRDNIAVGDKITTIGGMIGKVVHVADDRITFETGEDRVRIEVTKWAVSANEGRGANKETTDSEESLNS